MRVHLVKIGNSRGVRLPKAVIEEAGLGERLDLKVRDGAVILRSARKPRGGWAEAAAACREAGEDHLADWDAAADDGDWS